MFGVVYEIRNLIDGKRYIGLTRFNAQKRWKEHVYRAGSKPKTYLHLAIAKHGVENFTITEVASCLSFDFLAELEKNIIIQENPEYNQTCGGEVTFGRKYSDEVKDKIRRKNTGKKRSEQNRKRTSEVKLQQYKENPELAIKATKFFRENRAKWEDKRKKACSEANRSRKMPDDLKERLRHISKTRHRSLEEIAKIAAAKTKKVKCENDGKVYDSRHEAAAAYGVSERTVWRSCKNRTTPVSGYRFTYL